MCQGSQWDDRHAASILVADGNKPGEGTYGDSLKKAHLHILEHVQNNGVIASAASGMMYALRFLAEVQIAQPMQRNKDAMRKAVGLIVASQNELGGWRYQPKPTGADSSVTACVLTALMFSRRAGADVPNATIEKAVEYLKTCQNEDGGFSYLARVGKSGLERSAAVMAALYLSGSDGPWMEIGLGYLNKQVSEEQKLHFDYYAQLHLSTAFGHAGELHFYRWYKITQGNVLDMQLSNGSWERTRSVRGVEYDTAHACLVLLAPNRVVNHKPIGPTK